jgi:hypothetical protein
VSHGPVGPITPIGPGTPRRFAAACARQAMACAVALAGSGLPAHAQDLSGDKRVVLSNPAGERLEIGRVRFEPAGAGRWRFTLSIDPSVTTERFLAMRPFRCVAGPRQQLCHFPQGSDNVISRDDLLPLEYALLFLHTKPGALHVDSRNGVFYKLAFSAQGLRGELHDVDVDPLITPRGDGNRRPLTYRHLERADPRAHWLPGLLIE